MFAEDSLIYKYEEYIAACNRWHTMPMFTFRDWVMEYEDYDSECTAAYYNGAIREF